MSTMRTAWMPVALLLTVAGCGGGADRRSGTATDLQQPDSSAPSSATPDPAGGWAVTPRGAGGVRVGASLAELQPMLATPPDTSAMGAECTYVQIRGVPEGMAFMVVGGQLVRIDVDQGTTPTEEGARIGDSEARVMELYPSATRAPHKYTDGAYLVAVPGAPADTISRLVFETDGRVVTRFRAGLYPQVEWVEGCG